MKKINRKTLPKWTRCLSASEIRHMLEDAGGMTIEKARKNFAHQQKQEHTSKCWDCVSIGRKLQEAGIID